MDDYSEYQHRDQLVDQICHTMCKLLSVVSPADLLQLQDLIVMHIDHLNVQFCRFKNRVVPEKATAVMEANNRLTELVAEEGLHGEQRQVISLLCNTFLTDIG